MGYDGIPWDYMGVNGNRPSFFGNYRRFSGFGCHQFCEGEEKPLGEKAEAFGAVKGRFANIVHEMFRSGRRDLTGRLGTLSWDGVGRRHGMAWDADPGAHGKSGKVQTVCKPGSVPRTEIRGDGHSSGTVVADRLARPTRTTTRERVRCPLASQPVIPIRSCSRWGLPCRSRCRSRGALLPHPFTLTQEPGPRSLAPGRFAFCGTVPGVAPAGCYPAPCSRGARTFLPCPCGHRRPPDRLNAARGKPPPAVRQEKPMLSRSRRR